MDVISIRVVCTGAKNIAIVQPSDVFAEAVKERASAVVISHNHPSGNPAPSVDDLKITLRLYRSANILGVKLLDHIILTRTNYFSFLEHRFLTEGKLVSLVKSAKEKQSILDTKIVEDILCAV